MRLELLYAEPQHCSYGDTPALLFIHGSRHAAWCWQKAFLPYFAHAGYPAFALSFRGHGGSPGHEALPIYRLNDYIDDVLQALAQLPPRPIVIGHSMGGAVVQRLLLDHQQRVRAAVLMASVPPDGVRLRDRLRVHLASWQAQIGRAMRAQGGPFPYQMFLSESVAEADKEWFIRLIQAESPHIQRDIRRPLVPQSRPISVPMLVLGAGKDWFLSPGAVRRTASFYGTEAVIFDNMAHDMMLEPGWQQVADSIIAFQRTLS